jgi:lipoprotein-anchoring transpeptidase ErfK/SrfK
MAIPQHVDRPRPLGCVGGERDRAAVASAGLMPGTSVPLHASMNARSIFRTLRAAALVAAFSSPLSATGPAAGDTLAAELRLVVNVAAGRMDVWEGDSLAVTYPVSVGLPTFATPTGSHRIQRVTWNPWWNPPPDAAWARGREPERPGNGNPMGRVKLFFRGPDYYIHGTQAVRALGRPASHGCIRMANRDVMELARRIHAVATPQVSGTTLDRLAANAQATREIALPRRVRLDVVYHLAEVRNGKLELHPDVYRRGGDALAEARVALMDAGWDPRRIDAAQVRALTAGGRGASIALEDASVRLPEPAIPAALMARTAQSHAAAPHGVAVR